MPSPGTRRPGQIRTTLHPLLDRPGHATAVSTTLAVVAAGGRPQLGLFEG